MINMKLAELGCDPLLDITPTLSKMNFTRVDEIITWINSYTENGNVITSWVAIDDMELERDKRMQGHFVLTQGETGVTKEDAEKAIQILNQSN